MARKAKARKATSRPIEDRPRSLPTVLTPFIVYGLPRSRTFWLSRFLTYREWQCGHDELRHARTLDDVASWLSQPCTGTVETNAAPFWRLACDVRTIVVRRPVEEVVDSMVRLGFPIDRPTFTKHIEHLDRKLDQIEARVPNVLSVTFADLKNEDTCKLVFEHCLGLPHDHAWWAEMATLNLQINMDHMMRYFIAHFSQLDKLAKIAKHKMIAGISRTMVDAEHDDGFVFAEEKFAKAFADGQRLFADHCVLVGETPDAGWGKNLELLQRLEDLDALQIMTARSNGRLFGYLVTLLAPSLESPDIRVATQTTFFTDPTCKGLGMRLQRAAVERLREKGIDEAYFHAGVRGAGPRMGTLYRRIGAAPYGEWYKLDLGK